MKCSHGAKSVFFITKRKKLHSSQNKDTLMTMTKINIFCSSADEALSGFVLEFKPILEMFGHNGLPQTDRDEQSRTAKKTHLEKLQSVDTGSKLTLVFSPK